MHNLHVIAVKYSLPNFVGIDDLCKLGKDYLTALTCKLCISF